MPLVTVVNRSRGNFTLSNPFGSLRAGESKTASLTDKQLNSMHAQLTNLHKGGFISYEVAGAPSAVPAVAEVPTPLALAPEVKPVEVEPVLVVVPEVVVASRPEAMPEAMPEEVEPILTVAEISEESPSAVPVSIVEIEPVLSENRSRRRRN